MVEQASAKSVTHSIQPSWCKGCGICVHFCPKKVLELDEEGKVRAARPEECIGCKLCQYRCPDLAIEVLKKESGKNREDGNGKQ